MQLAASRAGSAIRAAGPAVCSFKPNGFLEAHGGRIGQLAIYGQESNYTTWRLAKMNLAVRGIDASGIAWNDEGSFHKDEWRDKKFDFILANPSFNVSDWGGERLREDVRWKFGAPPVSNANYGWLQHIIHHLAPNGTPGVVPANGSMSSGQSGEDVIRRAMVEADVVDCMIALPGQLFYSTQIPACLWFRADERARCRAMQSARNVARVPTAGFERYSFRSHIGLGVSPSGVAHQGRYRGSSWRRSRV